MINKSKLKECQDKMGKLPRQFVVFNDPHFEKQHGSYRCFEAPKGEEIKLRHGEVLLVERSFYDQALEKIAQFRGEKNE